MRQTMAQTMAQTMCMMACVNCAHESRHKEAPSAWVSKSIAQPNWRARRLAASAQSLAGYVLLPKNAPKASSLNRLKEGKGFAQATWGMPVLDTTLHQDKGMELTPYRVLEDAGLYVRVRSLSREVRRAQCQTYLSHVHWNALEVEFWVRRSDLVPVLKRTVKKTFEDGTGYWLRAGLPVLPTYFSIQQGWALDIQGLRLELPHVQADIGLSYPETPALASHLKDGAKKRLRERVVVSLNAKTFARSDELPSTMRQVQGHESKVDEVLFWVSNTCAKLSLRAALKSKPVVSYTAQVNVQTGGMMGEREGLYAHQTGPSMHFADLFVRQGALLYWSDGRVAGKVMQPDRLAFLPVKPLHGLMCFRPHLGFNEPLCVKPNQEHKF